MELFTEAHVFDSANETIRVDVDNKARLSCFRELPERLVRRGRHCECKKSTDRGQRDEQGLL